MSHTTLTAAPHNIALTISRLLAGLLGSLGLTGAAYFLLVAPEEAVWVGPWLDVPIVTLMLTGMALKLAVALWPGLPATRRIGLGFLAVGISVAVTLLKIPLYDEPEGVVFLLFDTLLLLGLALAARSEQR